MITLKVYKLRDDIELPKFGTSLSNCFDLTFQPIDEVVNGYDQFNIPVVRKVISSQELSIYPGERLLIPTGLIFKIEQSITIENYSDISRNQPHLKNYSIRIHSRSGSALKHGLFLANNEGIVDVDYQEQVFVLLMNASVLPLVINRGERIAQAEIVCNESFFMTETIEKPTKYSERSGGFGSTGI